MSTESKQGKSSKTSTPKTPRKHGECKHQYCHRNEIVSDKPIGLPWASGRLTYLPGEKINLRGQPCAGECIKKKSKSKKTKKCMCAELDCKVDPFAYTYPKYIDICNPCLVDEELKFFLKLIVIGNAHHEKEAEKIKEAEAEAKKKRKECIKKRREAGEEVEDDEEEDEEPDEEEQPKDEETEKVEDEPKEEE